MALTDAELVLPPAPFPTSGVGPGRPHPSDGPILESAAAVDSTPPTVTVVSPTEGTPVASNAVLTVDIEDETGLANVVVYAEFPTKIGGEVVHTGDAFLAPYAALSTRTPIANGFRFALQRDGGWPGDVSITGVPVDTGGNTAVP